ncbi:conserved hypothetical protein [Methylobacterium sp. 4-46]|uniref:DUF3828 domain-containing protein n=1 Tax=unclassified Methylobacterium TaxID=2615210 RepID=UPI000165CA31|nr:MULTISPECIES: DUF3828 domain-containing protein [Methylobacterium]ACA18566.1 conserved hypothetical protein [Methylobacterium sp. 4-46]WFT77850.1 DUF3828 domain-containing protein [Methylobacterium nodulans]
MTTRRIPPALALALALAAGPALAQAAPDAPVREAYRITVRSLAAPGPASVPPWRPPHRRTLFSKRLAALFARDDLYQKESGDIGHLDADPFLSGQDGEVKDLRVTVETGPAEGRAEVAARFVSFGTPVTVRFRVVEEAGAWRIDDILDTVEGREVPVSARLTAPYPCGSFVGKRCRR